MTIWNVLFLLLQLVIFKSRSETIITAHNDFGLAPIDPEIADVVDWKRHACRRTCKDGAAPLDCYYTFKLEYYHTMSKACYDCPFNITDCFRPHCVPADGIKRSVMVVNRQLPGLPIEVCQGDRIIVDMINLLPTESTTMHWHGQHHVNTPYMDGVPYVSQCPIHPGATFRYNYIATEAGTHFWHSHSGYQRGDGVFGPLIVRVPPKIDWHKDLYDHDEYTLVIADWIHELGLSKFLSHYHSDGHNKAPNLLINGLGRFNTIEDENETLADMPITTFVVKPNFRYRFRLINAEFLNCPIEISVDNHTLYVVSSDGRDIEPVQAESLVSYAGERFDFIIEMDQPVDNYWMRFRGLMDCDERFLSAYQVAIMRYDGALEEEPAVNVSYHRVRNDSYGLQVNALNEGTESNNSISMPLLNAMDNDDASNIREPDYQFYISYDFYAKDNPHFHRKDLYGYHQVKQKVLTPQLNHISMKLLPFPLLPGRHLIKPEQFCNSSTIKRDYCENDYCACTHVLQVKINSVVELVLIDEGVPFEANHPFHLHGYQFRVVAMEKVGDNTTADEVRELDRQGLIHRKLKRAPLKDTVTVPDGGYTIVRFHADNPGYWLFHCHIEFHAEIGMSLIFKVGDDKEMSPVPNNFPTCGDWKPSDENEHKTTETSTTPLTEGKQSNNNKRLANVITHFSAYMAYFEQLLNLHTSSASSSSVTLLLFIACLLSSVMRVQTF
ncbi:PREDICTED: laccase-1-like isoform X2 [Wasmannia auropunctata]|nr:PREDICTED: laccase-1-like isoform X2 [Wasmannia auropunctata]XP_011688159.1 PREDICTED: laccase-1-like isoform X2 [Wasmannia auropunctata]XP_011688160.1 PREDICTED: laccase-1-like isoform X2 [Wasmannia auropunctata]XP_011688161.1 PREDICTED: laccase-1-like isoform X2 [Wasmannia auropunctata]XP_011688162.1 PREDICTED: laccase-1-like isoform X2 [Wasmannia auropunctata]